MRKPLSNGSAGFVVKHREFIDVVTPPNAPDIREFLIQPGLDTSFPWLAGVALNYQKYQIRNLTAHYVPNCATNQNGLIGMAFEYNASEDKPTSYTQLAQYSGFTQSSVWDTISVQHDAKHPLKFITSSVDVPGDANMYHSGKLLFYNEYTGGASTNVTVWGRIYISYDIALHIPQVATPLGATDQGSSEAELPGTLNHTSQSLGAFIPQLQLTKDNKGEVTNGNVGDVGSLFQFKAGNHLLNATANLEIQTGGDVELTFGLAKSTDGGNTFDPIVDSEATFQSTTIVGDRINLASQTLVNVLESDVFRWFIVNRSAIAVTWQAVLGGISFLSAYLGSQSLPSSALTNTATHIGRPSFVRTFRGRKQRKGDKLRMSKPEETKKE